MEKCKHVSKIRPAWDHSILNPEKWQCYLCNTTESVWACLSCSNAACGRFNEKHALLHFQESKHPISIEVNNKYVYCYVCDDYVLNDNAAGDLKLLRSALSAIATQKFTDLESSRGRRLLRSYTHTGIVRSNTDEGDKLATAMFHQRQSLMARTFAAWRAYYKKQTARKVLSHKSKSMDKTEVPQPTFKVRTLIPGVTGLRNLGNTCYMNSILQVLSHIKSLKDFFLSMKFEIDVEKLELPPVSRATTRSSPPSAGLALTRQTTVECFEYQMLLLKSASSGGAQKQVGGLNGGASPGTSEPEGKKLQLICEVESTTSNKVWLCGELHGLLRVLWSGKWAQVSPHAFLQAVWQAIPMFRGYAQHDAQEFLCELLDKVQREIDGAPKSVRYLKKNLQLLTDIFQGQLVSEVTCLACGNISQRYEAYMDLSLEFPQRYQITTNNPRVAQDICHITEMLATFTEEERLEGEIYACEKCNRKRKSPKTRTVYTAAKKQLLINRLPHILRLHLKRFRWSGRLHREKISTHVAADEILDLRPFCSGDKSQQFYNYRLFAVAIHHGKGFGSGHYTSYTWNMEADSWVHCNDSRMTLCHLEEVLQAQAYILFYEQIDGEQSPLSSCVSPSSSDEDIRYSLADNISVESGSWEDGPSSSESSQEDIQVVETQISFRFKLPEAKSQTNKDTVPPSRRSTGKLATKSPAQNTRSRGKRSLDSGTESNCSSRKKQKIFTQSSNSSGSKAAAEIHDTSFPIVRCVKLDPASPQSLLNAQIKKNEEKAKETPSKHLKRRRSTIW